MVTELVGGTVPVIVVGIAGRPVNDNRNAILLIKELQNVRFRIRAATRRWTLWKRVGREDPP